MLQQSRVQSSHCFHMAKSEPYNHVRHNRSASKQHLIKNPKSKNETYYFSQMLLLAYQITYSNSNQYHDSEKQNILLDSLKDRK